MGEASQRPLHFLTKGRHLRKKIRPKVQFLSDFFQFVVFLPWLFFLATGPASSVTPLTRATKRKKKPRQGHNELKTRFSNGPTKTEPLLKSGTQEFASLVLNVESALKL